MGRSMLCLLFAFVGTLAKELVATSPTVASLGKPFRQATNGSTPAGWIQLGTPKKWLLVIFDTGSDKLVAKTWETVAAELSSVDQGISGMVMPSQMIYDHNASSSYQRNLIFNPITHKNQQKQSSITYGSGTAITDEGTDRVFVGNRHLDNFTLMEITQDSLQLLHTSKGLAGVLGLQHMKNKSLGNSLFSQMREADVLNSFGYCRGTGNNGTFIWGDDSTEGHEMEVIGQMHWAVKLGGVKIQSSNSTTPNSLISRGAKAKGDWMAWPFGGDGSGDSGDASTQDDVDKAMDDDFGGGGADEGKIEDDLGKLAKALGLDHVLNHHHHHHRRHAEVLTTACPDDKCTAILDTGSNIIAGPSDVMKSITKTVNVKPDCSNFDSLPNIEMTLGGLPVTIPPSGYVMKVPMPSWSAGGMGGDGDQQGDEEGDFARQMGAVGRSAFQDGARSPEGLEVVIVEPGHVRRHRPGDVDVIEAGLAEEDAKSGRAATHRRWTAVFERLNRNYGIDLRDMVNEQLKTHANHTSEEFMCMPALVPLDKKTQLGPLYVVGTPLLDAYYARWSFTKSDTSPRVHLKDLRHADVCRSHEDASVPGLMRMESGAKSLMAPRSGKRGPTERIPEEIAYPHWAKDLFHV